MGLVEPVGTVRYRGRDSRPADAVAAEQANDFAFADRQRRTVLPKAKRTIFIRVLRIARNRGLVYLLG
jgi:hypothetical protein